MVGPNSSESHELGVVLGLYIHQQRLYSTIAYSAPASYQLSFKVLLGSSSLLYVLVNDNTAVSSKTK